MPAIFIYLTAEIGVGNLFINFVSQPEIGNLTHEQASRYLFLLWGGMMIGRLVGAFLMQKVDAARALAFASIGATVVMLIAAFTTGHGLQTSFLLTAACELYVLFYALWGSRLTEELPAPEAV